MAASFFPLFASCPHSPRIPTINRGAFDVLICSSAVCPIHVSSSAGFVATTNYLLHPLQVCPAFLPCPPASSSAALGRDEERSKQLRWPSSMHGRLIAAHFRIPTTYCNQPRYDLCPPFHFLLLLATTLYTAHHFLVCATLFMCSPIV